MACDVSAVTVMERKPTLIVFEPAAVSELKFELVGAKSAVSAVVALTALGVHEHVAVYGLETAEATEEQPVIAVPPDLKVTNPAVFMVAVMVTAVPYVAVVAPDGSESERVGTAAVTENVIADEVAAEYVPSLAI